MRHVSDLVWEAADRMLHVLEISQHWMWEDVFDQVQNLLFFLGPSD